MPDPYQRLWERLRARGKVGGRRLYEDRLRVREWTGEGGVKLKEAEKAQLAQRAYDEPTGQMFEEIGRNRQAANNLEGTTEIPQDWWVWLKDTQAKKVAAGEAD